MRDGMRIGELAERFDLNPKTIRYYEQIGLLPEAERTVSGYRRYGERDAERLAFIRRAKALDLSLDEIRGILARRVRGEAPCGEVLNAIDDKVEGIEQRIAQLRAFRDDLLRLRTTWANPEELGQTAATQICPIIEQYDEVSAPPILRRLEHGVCAEDSRSAVAKDEAQLQGS